MRWLFTLGFCLQSAAGVIPAHAEPASKAFIFVGEVFPDGSLVDCRDVGSMAPDECEKHKLFIGYMTWRLRNAMGWLPSYSTLRGFGLEGTFAPFYPAGLDKSSGREGVNDEIKAFYEVESRQLSECLRTACGTVISFSRGADAERAIIFSRRSHEEWAAIWDTAMGYLPCVQFRDRTKDTGQYQSDGGDTYTDARNGELPQCPPENVPPEVFDLGRALSPPSHLY